MNTLLYKTKNLILKYFIFFMILLNHHCPLVTYRKPYIENCKESSIQLMIAFEILRNSNTNEDTKEIYDSAQLAELRSYQKCEDVGYKGLIDIE